MKDAGIRVWVLTGDKIETAINIAYSCQLLNDDLEQIFITGEGGESVIEQLEKYQDKVRKTKFLEVINIRIKIAFRLRT